MAKVNKLLTLLLAEDSEDDFLFLDINMPKKNGWEVLEWMAGKPGLKHIPVAVVTTSEHHRDVKRAREFSLRGYLVKPARPEQLKKLLEAAD